MKNFLKLKAWPLVAGLLVASIVMLAFEFANSLLFPLPEGLDWTDQEAVRAVTAALPWTAYILVLLGWIAASFKAGCVTARLAHEERYHVTFVLGVILTVCGIANNIILGSSTIFFAISLPVFMVFTYLGHRYIRNVYAAREHSGV